MIHLPILSTCRPPRSSTLLLGSEQPFFVWPVSRQLGDVPSCKPRERRVLTHNISLQDSSLRDEDENMLSGKVPHDRDENAAGRGAMRTGWKLVHGTIAALPGVCLLDWITHVKEDWTGLLGKHAVFHLR